MSLSKKIGLVLPFIVVINAVFANPFIVVPLESPPTWAWSLLEDADAICTKLCKKSLDGFARRLTHSYAGKWQLPELSGFIGLYQGYLDYSDAHGMLSFPLHGHDEKALKLLITPDITLIPEIVNTMKGMQTTDSNTLHTGLYNYTQNKNNAGSVFWEVTNAAVSDPYTVSRNTVVLLTKADNVFVLEGTFPSQKSPHIILPPSIYIVGALDKIKDTLKALDVARFFEAVKYKRLNPSPLVKQIIPEAE